MITRMTHYLTALIFLLALAVVYQNLVSPWTEAPRVGVVAMAPAKDLAQPTLVQDLFPEGAWQRGLCKQLQTSSGMLLFQNWEQISNDQWRLWPVTVVVGRGLANIDSPSPVLIEAEEGAEIKFTEALDVMSGGAPPIQRGRIIGSVHIHRSTQADPSSSLDIKTANVGIDNRKIWTTEAIDMSVGKARCVGRDLTVHFATPTSPGAPGSGGGTEILDRMELIYLDHFTMPLEENGWWSDKETPAGSDENPTTVSLHCGGRVEYDFALDQLMLTDNVSLAHQAAGELADRFECEWLQLRLNDPTNSTLPRKHPLDWLLGITATGSPAVAVLPGFDSRLASERIDFDAREGSIRAEGEGGVQVRRGAIRAHLEELVYQFDPDDPEAILGIAAPGPGELIVDDKSMPLRKATWKKTFRFWPVDSAITRDMTSDVQLWIEGDVDAYLDDGGEFHADSIAGILSPEVDPDDPDERMLVPNRFEINGNVRIDTAALAAETKRLLLFFISEADPSPKSVAGNSNSETSPLRRWVSQPGNRGDQVDPVARPRPVIRGDVISAKLRRNSSGLSAKKLSVVGSVEVEHQLVSGDQILPARLTGESLQMIDGGGEDVLQLDSSATEPARFVVGDGFFIGPQIQIRPSDNVVWINDAGEFRMPSAALPTGLDGGNDIRWTSTPHCRWQGEMIFDGRTAVLSDGVSIDASLVHDEQRWDVDLTGDRLQIDLSEAVAVRDVGTMRSAKIQQVTLLQNDERPLLVRAMQYAADGVQEAKHLLHASRMTLTPGEGGQLVGDGPGWYRAWNLGKNDKNASGGERDTGLIEGEGTSLTGVHLVFADSMQADLLARSLQFIRGVRVGVQDVASWEATFDARSMDAISQGQSTLDCDRLRFTIEPGHQYRSSSFANADTSTPWEMEANEGVIFRTRSEKGLLEGTASRASYSSSKDLFTVHGAANQPAVFRQTRPDGTPGPEGAVRSMAIRPREMKLENAVFERFTAAPPQSIQ